MAACCVVAYPYSTYPMPPRRLLDQGGHAIIALSSYPDWPGHAGALADLVFEFRTDRAQVLCEIRRSFHCRLNARRP